MKHKNWPYWSLAANALLAGAVVFLARRPADVSLVAGAPHVATPAAPSWSPSPSIPAADRDDWRQWLGQLRSAGIPDRVLAGLVAADFESRWQQQRRDLQQRYERGDVDDATINGFVEAHDADQEQELRYALGAEGFVKWDKENILRDLNLDKAGVSAAEADSAYRMKKDFAQAEADLVRAHQDGQIDEADLDERQAAAEKVYEDKMKALLGDARYRAWKTPGDGARGELVRTLKTLNATDAQTQALLAAQLKWEQQRTEPSGNDSSSMQAATAARDAEYLRVLGPTGFARLQAAQDSRYQAMQRYAAAWQLNEADVDHVYGSLQASARTVQDYQQRAHDLETSGGHVDWPAVDANIQAYTQQTQQSLRTYLGDDRFNKLVKNSVLEF